MWRRFHAGVFGTLSIVTALAAAPAWAHSFDVDVVFAQTTPAVARDGFLREFRRASAERDSHANEESNGHLGGLDVYSNMAILGGGAGDLTGAFTVFAGSSVDCGAVAATGIVFDAAVFAGSADAAGYRADYESRYGDLPDALALSGYLAARQIGATVRPLGGVDDVAALREGFSGLCN